MMKNQKNLFRFLDAQENEYDYALQEIKQGKKTGHWMWYIFPQIIGLGYSEMSNFYAIKDKVEANEYLNHPVLGERLIEISAELLKLKLNDPVVIFGCIDSIKLKSSMTLFSLLDQTNPVFQNVLDKYFNGQKDISTIQLINTII